MLPLWLLLLDFMCRFNGIEKMGFYKIACEYVSNVIRIMYIIRVWWDFGHVWFYVKFLG